MAQDQVKDEFGWDSATRLSAENTTGRESARDYEVTPLRGVRIGKETPCKLDSLRE